jgi:hypothetical protein
MAVQAYPRAVEGLRRPTAPLQHLQMGTDVPAARGSAQLHRPPRSTRQNMGQSPTLAYLSRLRHGR